MLPHTVRKHQAVGAGYGLASWILFERLVAPLLGLRAPEERPLAERAALAADHVLYGVIVAHRPVGAAS